MLFVFFKQKTAYELRISDWSSEVCSSDLVAAFLRLSILQRRHRLLLGDRRQVDREGGALPHGAVDEDVAAGLLHDAIDGGEAEAGAGADLLGREEGIEDAVDDIRRDAGAGVLHLHDGVVARRHEIGRASGRERVCQYVEISVVAGSLKKK